jgi:folate-binding protein YgfZ
MTEFMNTWLTFLTRQGAAISESSQVLGFDANAQQELSAGNFVAPLTDLGLIAVTGDDAASFLHNQLTNDVEQLGLNEARLAGYCSPKGRLLASLLTWKTSDAIMLQLSRQIQSAVQKRLQMFVLRAKAKLSDVTENQVTLGLGGPQAGSVLAEWFPTLPATSYAKADSDAGTLIRLPDAFGAPRYQWITTAERAIDAWPKLTAALQPVGSHVWRLAEIDGGIPHITAATQDQFVPQMINFELIGGVNFKKGCYPGQEIVARSQYLGKLKRRMLRASIETESAEPGMEVFSVTDPEQPCGMIVNAERAGQQIECLVEIKLAVVETEVRLGSANGPMLHFKNLPYSLPAPA